MANQTRPEAGATGELEELRQRVAHLERAERTYRLVFEQSGHAVALLRDDRFVECNPRTLEVFACTRARLIGASPADFSPPLQPNGVNSAELSQALMREAASGNPQSFEWRHCKCDGTPFDAEVNLIGFVVDDEPMVQAIFRDVTEVRRAARSLAESENMLKLVLDTIPVRVFWKDVYLNYLGCNRAFAADAGLASPEEIKGLNDHQLRWSEHADEYRESDRKVIESGSAKVAYEERQNWGGRDVRWLRTSKIPLRNAAGEIVGVLCAYEDITEQKRAEEGRSVLETQLRHAQKLESLGLLAGGIAHDFNNLLMAILGNASLAREDLDPESRTYRNLAEVESAANRAAVLCNQMLAYSGKGRFVIDRVDLNVVVRGLAHQLDITLPKKARLTYALASSVSPIAADEAQIRQICLNLVTNAAEALGDRTGAITIRTGTRHCGPEDLSTPYLDERLNPGEYTCIEVADNGCGMDKETRERMFDPFFTTKFTGRGLGLAAVLGIVRGHQGAIAIESEPGKGTTFRVLFPVVTE